jgi:hypothetical protein
LARMPMKAAKGGWVRALGNRGAAATSTRKHCVAPAARPLGDLFGGGARSPRPRGIDLDASAPRPASAPKLEQDEGCTGSSAGGGLGASPALVPNAGSRTHLDGGRGARVGGRASKDGEEWRRAATWWGEERRRGEHRRLRRGGWVAASGRGGQAVRKKN